MSRPGTNTDWGYLWTGRSGANLKRQEAGEVCIMGSLIICGLLKVLLCYQFQKNEICIACSMHRAHNKCIQNFNRRWRGKNHLQGIDGILSWPGLIKTKPLHPASVISILIGLLFSHLKWSCSVNDFSLQSAVCRVRGSHTDGHGLKHRCRSTDYTTLYPRR
jgi:hypothetical protein